MPDKRIGGSCAFAPEPPDSGTYLCSGGPIAPLPATSAVVMAVTMTLD
jgi:hypothetical protein